MTSVHKTEHFQSCPYFLVREFQDSVVKLHGFCEIVLEGIFTEAHKIKQDFLCGNAQKVLTRFINHAIMVALITKLSLDGSCVPLEMMGCLVSPNTGQPVLFYFTFLL